MGNVLRAAGRPGRNRQRPLLRPDQHGQGWWLGGGRCCCHPGVLGHAGRSGVLAGCHPPGPGSWALTALASPSPTAHLWGTEEVAAWLEHLSLCEYKDIFTRHDIRGSELLHLERRDLKVLPRHLPGTRTWASRGSALSPPPTWPCHSIRFLHGSEPFVHDPGGRGMVARRPPRPPQWCLPASARVGASLFSARLDSERLDADLGAVALRGSVRLTRSGAGGTGPLGFSLGVLGVWRLLRCSPCPRGQHFRPPRGRDRRGSDAPALVA